MKKLSFLFFILFLLAGSVPVVHAQALSGSGGTCTTDSGCSGSLFCNLDVTPHVCQALRTAGQQCTNDNMCADPLFCDTGITPHVCSIDSSAGDNGAGAAPSTTAAPAQLSPQNTTDTGFVSLTKIPLFDQAGNAATLSVFLNALYKICIGLAAVLAVLQIMRAGVMYMGGDSVTEKSAARGLIRDSLLGLLLVLAPAIVFGIINPKILSLQIGGLDSLRVTNVGSAGGAANTPFTGTAQALWTNTSTDRAASQSQCTSQGGTTHFTCTPSGGSPRVVPITEACAAGESSITVCLPGTTVQGDGSTATAAQTASQCTQQYVRTTATPGSTCNGPNGYVATPQGCCAGIGAGSVCCGIPQGISGALLWSNSDVARAAQQTQCTHDGGVIGWTCTSSNGTVRPVQITEVCTGSEHLTNLCKTP